MLFDKYPKLKVLFVHMGGALAPVVCRLDWNWDLNYKGIQNPPIQKVDKNLRKPSEYFKSNIYVDTMGPSASRSSYRHGPRERRKGSELVRHPLTPSAACRWKRIRQRGRRATRRGRAVPCRAHKVIACHGRVKFTVI
jgi:hypothetical protein